MRPSLNEEEHGNEDDGDDDRASLLCPRHLLDARAESVKHREHERQRRFEIARPGALPLGENKVQLRQTGIVSSLMRARLAR